MIKIKLQWTAQIVARWKGGKPKEMLKDVAFVLVHSVILSVSLLYPVLPTLAGTIFICLSSEAVI